MRSTAARDEFRSRVSGTRQASAWTARSVLTTVRAARKTAKSPSAMLRTFVPSDWRCASVIALAMRPVSPALRAASLPGLVLQLRG